MGGANGAFGLQKADGTDEDQFFVTTAEMAAMEDLFKDSVDE